MENFKHIRKLTKGQNELSNAETQRDSKRGDNLHTEGQTARMGSPTPVFPDSPDLLPL